MAEIAGRYAVAEFQGRHPDQQIGERKTNAFRLVLAVVQLLRSIIGWTNQRQNVFCSLVALIGMMEQELLSLFWCEFF